MSDYLQRYLPEYDEDEARQRLAFATKEDLLTMLIRAYKEKRVLAKMLDEQFQRAKRIEEILAEPSKLTQMPDVPNAADLGNSWKRNSYDASFFAWISMKTGISETAAGVTPGRRLAWPTVVGRTRVRTSCISRDRPETAP